jgi:hypothetical protein
LFESLPFHRLVPDQSIIVDGPSFGGAKIRAARAEDGTFAVIYSPRGEAFTLNKQIFSSPRLKEHWYDPRYGTFAYVHTTYNASFQTYAPPTSGRGNDWILVLEDQQLIVSRQHDEYAV